MAFKGKNIGESSDSIVYNSTKNNIQNKPKICFVGSSLTQHGNNWSPTKITTDSRGWPCWLMMMLQESAVAEQWLYTDPVTSTLYTVGSNRGFSGQFSKQINARKADIAKMKADIYIIQQGTNDLSSIDTQTTISNTIKTARFLRDTGAVVVLMTEPCRNFSIGNGWESGGVAQLRREALNSAKRSLASTDSGILCVESDKYLLQATGEAKTGYLYDGIHFSQTGAYYLALAIYETIVPKLLQFNPKIINAQGIYDAIYNPNGNLFANPTLLNAANGFTKSSLPTGVTVFNVVNNADNTTTVTITTDGSGTAGSVSSVYLTKASPKTHNIGEAVRCGIKIKAVAQSDNMYGIRAYTRAAKTGETSIYAYGAEKYISSSYVGTKTSYWPVNSTPMYNKTPALVVPFDGATITNGVYFDVNAGVAGTNIIVIEGMDARSGELPWVLLGVAKNVGYSSQNYYGGSDI